MSRIFYWDYGDGDGFIIRRFPIYRRASMWGVHWWVDPDNGWVVLELI